MSDLKTSFSAGQDARLLKRLTGSEPRRFRPAPGVPTLGMLGKRSGSSWPGWTTDRVGLPKRLAGIIWKPFHPTTIMQHRWSGRVTRCSTPSPDRDGFQGRPVAPAARSAWPSAIPFRPGQSDRPVLLLKGSIYERQIVCDTGARMAPGIHSWVLSERNSIAHRRSRVRHIVLPLLKLEVFHR